MYDYVGGFLTRSNYYQRELLHNKINENHSFKRKIYFYYFAEERICAIFGNYHMANNGLAGVGGIYGPPYTIVLLFAGLQITLII